MTTFLTKQQAAELLSVSTWTLGQWRRQGILIEGIHYMRLNSRTIRYVKGSLEHWILTRSDQQAHEAYCEEFIQRKNAIS